MQHEVHHFLVLEPVINQSDLVISHCGAGVLLECLRSTNPNGTKNIAVVNTTLMGNHQSELGDKLHEEGWNLSSTPDKVLDDLKIVLGNNQEFKPFPEAKQG